MELAAIMASQKSETDNYLRSVRVSRDSIWGLLKESRWPNRIGCATLRNGDAALIVLPQSYDDSGWTQQTRDLLRELERNGFSAAFSRALTGAVIEMVDNVWTHGEAQHPGLLAYQIRRRKFAFSVLDTGIGMLNSLRQNAKFKYLTSSMEAIGKAVEPGVSRFDGNGGMGYPSLFHALASLWGTARIRSGQAALMIDHTGETRTKEHVYLPHLPGVHISVRCSLDPPKHPRP